MIFSKIKSILFTILSVLAVLLFAYRFGGRAAIKAERNRQDALENKALKKRMEVRHEVNKMSDADVDRELRANWMRNG